MNEVQKKIITDQIITINNNRLVGAYLHHAMLDIQKTEIERELKEISLSVDADCIEFFVDDDFFTVTKWKFFGSKIPKEGTYARYYYDMAREAVELGQRVVKNTAFGAGGSSHAHTAFASLKKNYHISGFSFSVRGNEITITPNEFK